MTQQIFERIAFAVSTVFEKSIADATNKAFAEMVNEWVKFKNAEAEKANAHADTLEEAANEGE